MHLLTINIKKPIAIRQSIDYNIIVLFIEIINIYDDHEVTNNIR